MCSVSCEVCRVCAAASSWHTFAVCVYGWCDGCVQVMCGRCDPGTRSGALSSVPTAAKPCRLQTETSFSSTASAPLVRRRSFFPLSSFFSSVTQNLRPPPLPLSESRLLLGQNRWHPVPAAAWRATTAAVPGGRQPNKVRATDGAVVCGSHRRHVVHRGAEGGGAASDSRVQMGRRVYQNQPRTAGHVRGGSGQ